jgi:membrane-associated phospholipid phosphatase
VPAFPGPDLPPQTLAAVAPGQSPWPIQLISFTEEVDAGEGPVFHAPFKLSTGLFDPMPDDSADPIFDDDAASPSAGKTASEPEPCCFTFGDDARGLIPVLWNDTVSCFTWTNAIILAVGGGVAAAIREHLDGDVRDYTEQHVMRWSEGSQVLRQFGEFSYQLPALFTVYGWSLWSQDERMHEFSKAVISAYGISAVATVTIKGITDTGRPSDQFQDGRYGFPSYHASSTFAIAAVADEYYGWPVGLPCYVLAGLVGWSRIDQREHDLSDVVFGSILGFVIGKSVAATHMDGITGCEITPWCDPATSSFGAIFHTKF